MSQFIDRRLLLAGGAIVSALGAGEASAQTWWPFGRRETQAAPATQADPHAGHHGAATPSAELSAEESAVIAALSHCDDVGEACLTHCLALLSAGDTSMAACARAVREMLAVCRATRTLLQSRSALAAAQLAVCRDACSACRATCQAHAAHHAQCGACAQSCAAAIAAIDALFG